MLQCEHRWIQHRTCPFLFSSFLLYSLTFASFSLRPVFLLHHHNSFSFFSIDKRLLFWKSNKILFIGHAPVPVDWLTGQFVLFDTCRTKDKAHDIWKICFCSRAILRTVRQMKMNWWSFYTMKRWMWFCRYVFIWYRSNDLVTFFNMIDDDKLLTIEETKSIETMTKFSFRST